MRFTATPIEGVTIVDLDWREDDRGGFARSFCEEEFERAGLPFRVRQANVSRNALRHTLRGMHYQVAPHGEPKIVSCSHGRIFDVAVDLRPDSPTYLEWTGAELSAHEGRALYIAEGLAHGFLTLEADSEVRYLMGAPYEPAAASGVRWDDPRLAIAWPAAPQSISDRDAAYPLLDNQR